MAAPGMAKIHSTVSPRRCHPFNQKIRIAGLRSAILEIVPLLLFSIPVVGGLPAALVHGGGILCIVTAVQGPFWAILYTDGHKNGTVMQNGQHLFCFHLL